MAKRGRPRKPVSIVDTMDTWVDETLNWATDKINQHVDEGSPQDAMAIYEEFREWGICPEGDAFDIIYSEKINLSDWQN